MANRTAEPPSQNETLISDATDHHIYHAARRVRQPTQSELAVYKYSKGTLNSLAAMDLDEINEDFAKLNKADDDMEMEAVEEQENAPASSVSPLLLAGKGIGPELQENL